MNKFVAACLALILASFSFADSKGSGLGCNDIKMGPEGVQKAAQLATKLEQDLEQRRLANGTNVVMLARVGSNSPVERFKARVSDYWRHTHAALASHSDENGWRITHLLNSCGNQSDVYNHSLMQFFLDDPYQYRVMVAEPNLALQARLYDVLETKKMAAAYFNQSTYSSVSQPFNTQRQNSNEFILDVLVAAMAPENTVFTREQSKAYLNANLKMKVRPELVEVGGLENFGISLGFGPDNATLDDHTKREIKRGELKMVSVGTLHEFLVRTDNLLASTELRLVDYHRANDTIRQGNGRN